MSTVQPTDKVLVNRAGVDYSQQADTLMATIQDTDLMLVNRAGVDYKCSGLDFKAAMKPPETVDKPRIITPANNAVDLAKTPTLTSSAFSGTNASHVSTDWQVTTKADTGFAAIVQQSMADTTNKVSWTSGDLALNTDYIARVRYHSAGAVSAWSDVVSFKTKAALVDRLPPSKLYFMPTGQGSPATLVTAATRFVNGASNYNELFAFGVDDNLYKIAGPTTVTSLGSFIGKLGAGASVAQGGIGYNGSISVIDTLGGLYGFSNTSYAPDINKPLTSIPGAEADLVCPGVGYCDAALGVSNKLKKVYVFYPGAGATVKLDGISQHKAVGGWEESGSHNYLFAQHPSPIRQIVTCGPVNSNYMELGKSCVLYEDGALFVNKRQVGPGTKWLQIMPIGDLTGSNSVWAIKDGGNLVSIDSVSLMETAIASNAISCFFGYTQPAAGAYLSSSNRWCNYVGTPIPNIPAQPANVDIHSLNGFGAFVVHNAASPQNILIPDLNP